MPPVELRMTFCDTAGLGFGTFDCEAESWAFCVVGVCGFVGAEAVVVVVVVVVVVDEEPGVEGATTPPFKRNPAPGNLGFSSGTSCFTGSSAFLGGGICAAAAIAFCRKASSIYSKKKSMRSL